MKFSFALAAATAAVLFVSPFASADEKDKSPGGPAASAEGHVLVLGDGAVRLQVERNASAGRMTFRLADPNVKLDGAPTIVMTTDAGRKEITLTPLAGQPGTWIWTDDSVKAERFDGSLRVVLAGKTYTSPLTTVWTAEPMPGEEGWAHPATGARVVARYGGRILTLPDCGASVEVVQDLSTGTLTIYSTEDVVITDAPVITVTESEGPATITLTKVEGKNGAWMATNRSFRTTLTSARIRLIVNGKPCEAPLTFTASGHGGQVVVVPGGPSMEVVHDAKSGEYTFYAVDETIEGKTYTIENPTVVVQGRTYNLTPVPGEPRAWRLVGFDAAGTTARDAQLNFTLFGKTLSTRFGLSGLGIDVK